MGMTACVTGSSGVTPNSSDFIRLDADDGKNHAPAEKHALHSCRFRTQRQTDPDLPPPLGHGVRHHPVDADDAKQQRHTARGREHRQAEGLRVMDRPTVHG
jgi:hypothetical protein